ncbi:hypothetical protein [Agrobacterium tumefaciens]|uniref:hypothetical protein n=1 Tax=Agrobacterium tumefaciens TaxID=358 RepID=UPI002FDC1019
MPTKPPAAEIESKVTERRSTPRVFPAVARLLFLIVRGLTKTTLYTAWCLAFYILSMFRPFTGMAMLAAIVMVPLSIAAFVKPEAANGMPFWGLHSDDLRFRRLLDRIHDLSRLDHATRPARCIRTVPP